MDFPQGPFFCKQMTSLENCDMHFVIFKDSSQYLRLFKASGKRLGLVPNGCYKCADPSGRRRVRLEVSPSTVHFPPFT